MPNTAISCWRFYASGFADQRALSLVNLYYYGGGFDLLAALAAKVLPFTLFETRRLAGRRWSALLGLLVTWRTRHGASADRSRGSSRSCCWRPARSISATCS